MCRQPCAISYYKVVAILLTQWNLPPLTFDSKFSPRQCSRVTDSSLHSKGNALHHATSRLLSRLWKLQSESQKGKPHRTLSSCFSLTTKLSSVAFSPHINSALIVLKFWYQWGAAWHTSHNLTDPEFDTNTRLYHHIATILNLPFRRTDVSRFWLDLCYVAIDIHDIIEIQKAVIFKDQIDTSQAKQSLTCELHRWGCECGIWSLL